MLANNQDNTLIASLFPDKVITDETNPYLIHGTLYLEEDVIIRNAAPRRRREFIAGRLCARRALDKIGIKNFPLSTDSDRTPVWPYGIVGSTSHTEGYCGVALALKTKLESVGFDAERIGQINKSCWRQICVQKELSWINCLSLEQQQKYITLIFSAKECFYKCQYLLTKKWLNFHDLMIFVSPNTCEFEVIKD